jgi:hypothetical protein
MTVPRTSGGLTPDVVPARHRRSDHVPGSDPGTWPGGPSRARAWLPGPGVGAPGRVVRDRSVSGVGQKARAGRRSRFGRLRSRGDATTTACAACRCDLPPHRAREPAPADLPGRARLGPLPLRLCRERGAPARALPLHRAQSRSRRPLRAPGAVALEQLRGCARPDHPARLLEPRAAPGPVRTGRRTGGAGLRGLRCRGAAAAAEPRRT